MGWDSIFLFPSTYSELKHMAGKGSSLCIGISHTGKQVAGCFSVTNGSTFFLRNSMVFWLSEPKTSLSSLKIVVSRLDCCHVLPCLIPIIDPIHVASSPQKNGRSSPGCEDFESHRSHWWVLSAHFLKGGISDSTSPLAISKRVEQYNYNKWLYICIYIYTSVER